MLLTTKGPKINLTNASGIWVLQAYGSKPFKSVCKSMLRLWSYKEVVGDWTQWTSCIPLDLQSFRLLLPKGSHAIIHFWRRLMTVCMALDASSLCNTELLCKVLELLPRPAPAISPDEVLIRRPTQLRTLAGWGTEVFLQGLMQEEWSKHEHHS